MTAAAPPALSDTRSLREHMSNLWGVFLMAARWLQPLASPLQSNRRKAYFLHFSLKENKNKASDSYNRHILLDIIFIISYQIIQEYITWLMSVQGALGKEGKKSMLTIVIWVVSLQCPP